MNYSKTKTTAVLPEKGIAQVVDNHVVGDTGFEPVTLTLTSPHSCCIPIDLLCMSAQLLMTKGLLRESSEYRLK